jgi:hypothetical protein
MTVMVNRIIPLAFCFAALASIVTAGGLPPGPVTPYYLTAGEQGKDWVVQVDAVIDSWNQQHKQGSGE